MAQRHLRVEILIEYEAWRSFWPRVAADARALVQTAAKRDELSPIARGEIALVFADDARLQILNSRFRGKHRPTNVLSFADANAPLGGIALSFDTVASEAQLQEKQFINHAKHMILHGFLHLLGYDHRTARRARLMEGLEIAILSDMGIPNPYLLEGKSRA